MHSRDYADTGTPATEITLARSTRISQGGAYARRCASIFLLCDPYARRAERVISALSRITSARMGRARSEVSDRRRGQGACREKVQRHLEALGAVLDPANDEGTHVATEITHRVDQRDATGGRRPGQKHRGHRPERRARSVQPDGDDRHRCNRPERAGEQPDAEEADCRNGSGRDQMPTALVMAVG